MHKQLLHVRAADAISVQVQKSIIEGIFPFFLEKLVSERSWSPDVLEASSSQFFTPRTHKDIYCKCNFALVTYLDYDVFTICTKIALMQDAAFSKTNLQELPHPTRSTVKSLTFLNVNSQYSHC